MTLLAIRLLLLLLLLAFALVAAGIMSNQPRLSDPPGAQERLRIYLTRNVALTTPEPTLPELQPRGYALDPGELYPLAREAVRELGWELESEDPDQQRLHAVITTRWLRFRDDFVVRIVPGDDAASSQVLVRSASRVGRGDLGANVSHVRRFNAALQAQVDQRASIQ
ncbi:MAG: DUF1499 domain-containing protein [Ectothiorhodospiraceae bacterium]|nr:DUF1499 domain-containing protein [Ectothiorhodospiraceae bacterium]MCH8503676.1 DUF1499 domain-containing protein [Ectothiorhodospiraceae bacterium]